MSSFNPMADYIARHNQKGWAVGRSDIRNDAIEFVYLNEMLSFPTRSVAELCTTDGSFYLAKIKTLRKLAKQNVDHA